MSIEKFEKMQEIYTYGYFFETYSDGEIWSYNNRLYKISNDDKEIFDELNIF